MNNIKVAAFYKFTALEDIQQLKQKLLRQCEILKIKGTILLSNEGINGTIAGSGTAINNIFDYLRKNHALSDLEYKDSWTNKIPFYRLKIKLKKEIVTMGLDGVDPTKQCGKYVSPKKWNDLINDPDVITIDTRNDYEIAIGTFKNAINPNTTNFREFPQYVEDNLSELPKDKKVAMFCTGGIRCERSTAFMMQQGFKEVYHLEGGILKYLEEVPEDESLWKGECFVFDNRVAVNHSLEKGSYEQCNGCRHPISAKDKSSKYYTKDICCPHCYEELTPGRLNRRTERHRQLVLSAERNVTHMGVCQKTGK